MLLTDKIEKIMFDNSLSVDDFLSKTQFSRGTYYNIKSGKKKRLNPEQAKVINKLYPEYTFDWLMGSDEVDEGANYGIKKGGLGVYLDRQHELLLLEDATYKIWYDKRVAVDAMKMVKDLLSKKQARILRVFLQIP